MQRERRDSTYWFLVEKRAGAGWCARLEGALGAATNLPLRPLATGSVWNCLVTTQLQTLGESDGPLRGRAGERRFRQRDYRAVVSRIERVAGQADTVPPLRELS